MAGKYPQAPACLKSRFATLCNSEQRPNGIREQSQKVHKKQKFRPASGETRACHFLTLFKGL
jgi:hypothetical protein